MIHHNAVMCVLLTAALPVWAAPSDVTVMDAKVLDVTPIYQMQRYREPARVCEERPVSRRTRRDPVGAVVGGVVGAVIGHELGRELGHRGAGALVGAGIGAHIGGDGHEESTAWAQQCYMRDRDRQTEQLVGYRVLYSLNGEQFETETREHPGRRLRVRVHLEPLE